MKKNAILMLSVLSFAVIGLLTSTTTSIVYAQTNLPLQSNGQGNGPPHGFSPPSQAQTQADIAKAQNSPEGQALGHVKQQLAKQLAQAGPNIAQVLENMTKAGVISCPLPINPLSPKCLLNPHTMQGMPMPPFAANPVPSGPILPPPK